MCLLGYDKNSKQNLLQQIKEDTCVDMGIV